LVVLTTFGVISWAIVSPIQAAPQTVRYTYDAANRLITVVYDKSGAIHYQYDESGNRTRKTVIGPGNPRADYDGNALADLWEYIYFGFTGVSSTGDPDHDGRNNAQEAICWTDPTNALSVLELAAAQAKPDGTNTIIVIQWPSAQYATYALDKGTNIVETNAFWRLLNNIPATPPLNTCTDVVTGLGPWFYRIKAE
jgi:YD repeat-containing protein